MIKGLKKNLNIFLNKLERENDKDVDRDANVASTSLGKPIR